MLACLEGSELADGRGPAKRGLGIGQSRVGFGVVYGMGWPGVSSVIDIANLAGSCFEVSGFSWGWGTGM